MEEAVVCISVRVPRATYDALVKKKLASNVRVSMTALVTHLLDEALGVKRKNGRKK